MDNSHAESAMTEVALALAMVFFCMMVLAMVSMGGGAPAGQSDRPVVETAILVPAGADRATASELASDQTLVVYHGGRYLTAGLEPFDPAAAAGGRIVLAVDPGLPMQEALKAQAGLTGSEIRLTPLNSAWLDRLAAPPR